MNPVQQAILILFDSLSEKQKIEILDRLKRSAFDKQEKEKLIRIIEGECIMSTTSPLRERLVESKYIANIKITS